MKLCKECQIEKELVCFRKDARQSDGYVDWCKECAHKNKTSPPEDRPIICSSCQVPRPRSDFKNSSSRPEGRLPWCWFCRDKPENYRETQRKATAKLYAIRMTGPRKAMRTKNKIQDIRAKGAICPGCKFDFSACPDKALDMVFEKSHIHNSACRKKLAKQGRGFFWACQLCNRRQSNTCGYWDEAGKFVQPVECAI